METKRENRPPDTEQPAFLIHVSLSTMRTSNLMALVRSGNEAYHKGRDQTHGVVHKGLHNDDSTPKKGCGQGSGGTSLSGPF